MSYCVNCGVELHETCSVCPLCHTEVHNPRHPVDENAPKPFPVRQGAVAPVQKADVLILISVVLAVTAGVCGLLNLLIFYGTYWSLYVIGGCALLWVFCLPVYEYPVRRRRDCHVLWDHCLAASGARMVSGPCSAFNGSCYGSDSAFCRVRPTDPCIYLILCGTASGRDSSLYYHCGTSD